MSLKLTDQMERDLMRKELQGQGLEGLEGAGDWKLLATCLVATIFATLLLASGV